MADIRDYSQTAASNTDLFPEGMAPSAVNDGMRTIQSALKKFGDDLGGSLATGGSANAYTVTLNTTPAALGENVYFSATANHTNTGAATLVVTPSGGAAFASKAIRKFAGGAEAALAANDIVSGGRYLFQYEASANGGAGAYILLNPSTSVMTSGTNLTLSSYLNEAKGADIASATTTDIGAATGNFVHITGTTTITGLGTVQAGTRRIVRFAGALTLTHNATSLILPGAANITTAANDTAIFVSEGSGNWRCVAYERASGAALVTTAGITLGTQVSLSGTSVDFTGIPAGTKRITINLVGASTNGTSGLMVQIGDSGGIEATGYAGSASFVAGTSTGTSLFTTGYGLTTSNAAAGLYSGTLHLVLQDSATNTWSAFGVTARSDTGSTVFTAGSKALSATLDRIRLTTIGGTDTFDAGTLNITYE